MSKTSESGTSTGRAGTTVVGELPGARRALLAGLGVVFWGYLLLRWSYDRFVEPDVNVINREPFVPTGPIEGAADALSSAESALGVVGTPVGWLAWLAEAATLGINNLPALAEGGLITVQITVVSILFGLVLAVPLAVARVYGGRVTRWVALGYTELIRGTPLLAQLFVLWYGLGWLGPTVRELPGVGVDGPLPTAAVVVAMIGFTINSSAYQSEYIRSALSGVDAGQLTAARSVGLSKLGGIRYVVLPQALRFAIPGWTNEFIYLVKYSSLASFITVPELFQRARNIGEDTFQFTEIYVVVAVFYLGFVLTTAAAMTIVENRTSIPGLGN
ncbi:MAG: amine acid ABC transporter, permease protein, 3-TM region, His/Glu/Gln/Arg/opine family [halophilic archaeon J07HX5]|jgi:amino acid ABC transporter membrane protein 2, PAAT family (TC 3.A.1.3.-)|nr:MAG: amine acid ABC transporter, permease protein, 3-TM region, His/Glu/Gln/Arg/opine family [halophilic archaeon J07HX5]